MTNVFLQAKFTGWHQYTTLISLALLSEDNNYCYIEFNNYETSQLTYLIEENIIKNLFILKGERSKYFLYDYGITQGESIDSLDLNNFEYIESDNVIRSPVYDIILFLEKYNDVQIISDRAFYTWILFCELFRGTANLPKKIVPCCHELNQDIARWYKISDRMALETNREIIASHFNPAVLKAKEKFKQDTKIESPEYNALWNAFLIKECYENTAINCRRVSLS